MNESVKTKQKRLFALVLFVVFFGCVAVTYFYEFGEQEELPKIAKVDLPSDTLNPQEIWMHKIDDKNSAMEAKLNFLEQAIRDASKKETVALQENSYLKSELSSLKRELKAVKQKPTQEPYFSPVFQEIPLEKRPVLKEVIIESPPRTSHHVDQTIPSGTTVRAVLVSSVDIPCSVNGASDPQPVKLRVIDNGHLPKGVEAMLKGGIIIAGVYGDLSNERVYMRLERLTQVKSDGHFIETEVSGFVSGEDGKYGVRGVVVDKSQKIIGNAAVSGVVRGVNDYFQAKARSRDCCDDYRGYACGVLQEGAFCGASNAFEKLTEYYINKAEQVNPVIQVTSGRIVDITFTHGAELGDLYTHDKVKETREESRRSQACAY